MLTAVLAGDLLDRATVEPADIEFRWPFDSETLAVHLDDDLDVIQLDGSGD